LGGAQSSDLRPFGLPLRNDFAMPFFRNFLYWIDKRRWKYIFLLATLEMSIQPV
jgi:hypothetical protein